MKLSLPGKRTILAPDPSESLNGITDNDICILDHIEKILEISKKYGIDKCLSRGKNHLDYVTEKLHINPLQAIIFTHLLNQGNDSYIKINEIAESLNCSNVKILKYGSECEALVKMKIIRCKKDSDGISYRIPCNIQESLIKYNELKPEKNENLSIYKLFTHFKHLFSERENSEYSYESMKLEILDLINQNMHLLFCQKIKSAISNEDDIILFICFCHLFKNDHDDNIKFYQLEFMFDSVLDSMDLEAELTNGNHILMKNNLIEYTNSNGFAYQDTWKLTDYAKKEFLKELNCDIKNHRNIIQYKKISKKKMYYNSKEASDIQKLITLLQEENFNKIIERLESKGMRKGFACLFSGGPGTGKTETAYQIAYETKRDIMFVDISDTKSMWYGGSEKRIKEIFNSYRNLAEKSDIAPILLINEADAIISKRKEISSANDTIDQTENTIQNIILQEIENLSGILIATSNLIQNMDKAFERRFLYKIIFENPCTASRKEIWQSMLPELSDNAALKLTEEFEISGGQIENIVRKIEVDAILNGKELCMENLIQYCRNEILNCFNMVKKIGFGA